MKCEQVEAAHFCAMTDLSLYTTGPLRHVHATGGMVHLKDHSGHLLSNYLEKMCRIMRTQNMKLSTFDTAALALWTETHDD